MNKIKITHKISESGRRKIKAEVVSVNYTTLDQSQMGDEQLGGGDQVDAENEEIRLREQELSERSVIQFQSDEQVKVYQKEEKEEKAEVLGVGQSGNIPITGFKAMWKRSEEKEAQMRA